MRRVLVPVLVGLTACNDNPAAPIVVDPGPINVVILAATQTTLHLRNDGGAGSYRVEFWGTVNSGPSGCFTEDLIDGHCPVHPVRLADSDPIAVDEEYQESLNVSVTGATIYGYKISSRRINSAVWNQTDCRRALNGAWVFFTCP